MRWFQFRSLTNCTLNDIIAATILNHRQQIRFDLIEYVDSDQISSMLQNALDHPASVQMIRQFHYVRMNIHVQISLENRFNILKVQCNEILCEHIFIGFPYLNRIHYRTK